MKTFEQEDIFFARWLLFVIIMAPIYFLAMISFNISMLWIILILIGPWIIFFRNELMGFVRDWCTLIKGEIPKKGLDHFHEVDDE